MKKLFFETKMTWKRVICFALVTAVVTAAFLILPGVKLTSLANMGATFEAWVLFALIIIMNCERALEAAEKTVVFFLISQPLIYLLQVPFSWLGWSIFQYYPRWLTYTVLCFPGALLAWQVKRDTVLSAVILSVATGLLAWSGVYFARRCYTVSPMGNLLSAVFCFALAAVLIAVLLQKKRNRLIAAGITLLVTVIAAATLFSGAKKTHQSIGLPAGEWEFYEESGDYIGEITLENGSLCIDTTQYGEETVSVINENGEIMEFELVNGKTGLSVREK